MKIIDDVFPAHVAVASAGFIENVKDLVPYPAPKGTGYVSTARVVVTDEIVLVAQDSPNGAQVVFQEAYESYEVFDKNYYVVTKSGKMLAFTKDTNCGCGSRLRSWNAYRTLTSTKAI